MATFSGEEQLDLLIKKLFYGVAKGGSSDNYNFSNEVHDSFLAVKPANIWTNAASIPTAPPTNTDTTVEVYTPNAGGSQNAPLELTAVSLAGNAGDYSNFRKQWVALDSSDNRLKNWIGPGYGGAYAARVYVGATSWDGTDADASNKGIQEISFGGNAAADWFFDYEAGVLFWTNENLSETGDFQGSANFTTDTSLIANGDVVYIKAYRYIGGTGLGSATNVSISASADDTAFPLVFADGANASAALKVDGVNPATYNPDSGILTTTTLSATASFTTAILQVNGNSTLGNLASEDTVTFSSRIASDFIPSTNNSKDLGSGSLKWAQVHATTFTGNLTGDVTGNVSGSSGSTTGNAATATALAAAVTIGGESFNGSQNINLPGVNAAGNQNTSGTAAKATAIAGGVLGSVPYQSDANTTAFLAGNTATTNLFMRSVGDGTDAAAPTFAAVTKADVGLGSVTNASQATIVAAAEASAANLYLPLSGGTITSDLSITGNLTVSGDFVQANSTAVNFEDAVLALGVPRDGSNAITNGTSIIDTGFNFVKTTGGAAITEFAALRYDISDDKFKFTRHADGGNYTETQLISGADNVAALKFNMAAADTVVQTDQADTLVTMPDGQFANAAAARSLGAVAKCRITITSTADGSSNFAPDIQGANGYVIKHNLDTQSIYAIAIKDPTGTPIPVFCKYEPINNASVRVTVGITADNEVYDIIVIG